MSSSVPFRVVEGQVEYRVSGVGAEHVGSFYEMKNRAYGICPMQVNSRTAWAARSTGAVCTPCTAGTARGEDKTSSTSQEPSRDSR